LLLIGDRGWGPGRTAHALPPGGPRQVLRRNQDLRALLRALAPSPVSCPIGVVGHFFASGSNPRVPASATNGQPGRLRRPAATRLRRWGNNSRVN
jgi:hypothetical protein